MDRDVPGHEARSKKPKKGDLRTIAIDGAIARGRGMGRTEGGHPVVVRGALPGEVVRVRIAGFHAGRWTGRIVDFVERSPDRVAAPCPVFGLCGGCTYQDLAYERQLKIKEEACRHAFRLAGLALPDLGGVRPSPVPFRYRGKLELTIAGREDGRGVSIGFNEWGRWDRVVDIEDCPIGPLAAGAVLPIIKGWARDHGIPAWDSRRRRGFLRYLVLRASSTGEAIACLVTAPADRPWPREDLAARIARAPLAGFLWAEQSSPASAVVPSRREIIRGTDRLVERVGPLVLDVPFEAFFQSNVAAFERLLAEARSLLDLRGSETICDLYAGVGTVGLYLADRAARLVGVEIVREAVEAARANAARAGLAHASFIEAASEDFSLRDLTEGVGTPPDLVILDPPRAGAHPRVIRRLRDLAPPRVLYISCEVASLARDVALLQRTYALEAVRAFDLFPHSEHVEVMALLGRRPAPAEGGPSPL